MRSYCFNDYYTSRQIDEFAAYCAENNIDITPIVEDVRFTLSRHDMTDEEKLDEIMQTVNNIKKGVGNLAQAGMNTLNRGLGWVAGKGMNMIGQAAGSIAQG